MNIKLQVSDYNIDYDFLGNFPKNIEEMKDDEIFNEFFETFKFTFIDTILTYYGNVENIEDIIKDSLILDSLNFKNLNNKKKWLALELVLINLFYQMHDTFFANDTLNLLVNNFNQYDEDLLLTMINDFNNSIFFAMQETLIVTPDKIKNINATYNDIFLLEEFIDNKESILKIIKNNMKIKNIEKEQYEKYFHEDLKDNWLINMYNGMILFWIDSFEEESYNFSKISHEDWENLLTQIYSNIFTWFVMFINEENIEIVVACIGKIYEFICNIIKKKYKISYEIYEISVIE